MLACLYVTLHIVGGRTSPSLRLDLVELGRQVLSNLYLATFNKLLAAAVAKDRTSFNQLAGVMTTMLADVCIPLRSSCRLTLLFVCAFVFFAPSVIVDMYMCIW
jgi:hypothetical protein